MKIFTPEAADAIAGGAAIVGGAARITPRDGGTEIRVWSGYGTLAIDGDNFLPLGDRAFAQNTSGAVGGAAQGLTLVLSRIESAALALLDPAEVKQASVVIYRLIFASDGKTLLDTQVFDRGRGDALESVDTIGDAASIRYAVESTARGLGRSGARMRSDGDQRLINPADGYFKFCGFAPEKMLYWGGKRPSRAGTATASTPGSYGS